MAPNEQYRRQVALLMQILPLVAEEACFALKGGTAINLFVRDMPRLSVDLDLTYLPAANWLDALAGIDAALKRIAGRIGRSIPSARVHEGVLHRERAVNKLMVRMDDAQVKVEVTPVLRGVVFDPEPRPVSPTVEREFGFAECAIVSLPDLYAGKIVAALDRQHPRDLFDVHHLMDVRGIDDDLRRTFIVYLVSHNRPLAELLAPTLKDIRAEFERGFVGMTDMSVELNALAAARVQLIENMVGEMPEAHKRFLVSFKELKPDWPLLGLSGVEELPAVRRRLEHLAKVDKARREVLLVHLKRVLALSA